MTSRWSVLRPDPVTLYDAWRALVEAEFEQAERLREWQEDDHYRPIAQAFADDPHRTDDPLLDALLAETSAEATWLDIGAGGGRYAVPLALHSQAVIAVEPSAGMRQVLEASARKNGITNLRVVPSRWPEGAADLSADLSLIANVSYDIAEIGPFLEAMERSTRQRCFALLMDRAPSSSFERLWLAVHGEPRIILPGMREFLMLLLSRGASPDVRSLLRRSSPMSEEEIRTLARRRLWLAEGSAKDRHLQRLLDQQLTAGQVDFQLPSTMALITWRPVIDERPPASQSA